MGCTTFQKLHPLQDFCPRANAPASLGLAKLSPVRDG